MHEAIKILVELRRRGRSNSFYQFPWKGNASSYSVLFSVLHSHPFQHTENNTIPNGNQQPHLRNNNPPGQQAVSDLIGVQVNALAGGVHQGVPTLFAVEPRASTLLEHLGPGLDIHK